MTMHKTLKSNRHHHRALFASAAGVAGLAVANWLMARKVERENPPKGSFISVDGVRLHYTDQGHGDPVLLIHGANVNGSDWEISGVAERLAKTNRVIIFDRPGCGHSERPRGRLWTVDQQAQLLHKALQQLKITRPIVVGHSFGAIVAIAFAIRYQAEMAGLVLLSGYYFWTLRPDVLQATLGALPVVGDLLRYTVSPLVSFATLPLFKKVIFAPAKVAPRFDAEYSVGLSARPSQIRATSIDGALMIPSIISMRQHYGKLTLPVIIFSGGGDKIVFKANSERLHAEIPGSVMQIIAGAGHMVHYFAPDDVTDAIKALAVEQKRASSS